MLTNKCMGAIILINKLILFVDSHNWNGFAYDAFIILGAVFALLGALYSGKKYGLSTKKTFFLAVSVIGVAAAFTYVLSWAETGFRFWGGKDLARVFIWVPVFVLVICKIDSSFVFEQCCDVLAPCICLFQAVSHNGCLFGGCCYGYPYQNGVYNTVLKQNVFPIQIVEAAVALSIAILILRLQNNVRIKKAGILYPLMMALFGVTRFLLEFARDNRKIVLGISNTAFHALLMCVVGVVWIYMKRDAFEIASDRHINNS